MQFVIKNLQKSINDIMRTIGYKPAYFQSGSASAKNFGEAREFSIVRQVGRNDYPRLHLYIKEDRRPIDQSTGLSFIFNLHLDQKKPSYKGSRAHGGEYDGDLINKEAQRIKDIISSEGIK